MASYDDVNTPLIAYVGVMSVILLVVIIVALQVVYYWYAGRQQTADEFIQAPAELGSLLAEQQASLTSYRLIDPQKQVVGIPIGRAMDLVVTELSSSAHAVEGDHGPDEGAAEK